MSSQAPNVGLSAAISAMAATAATQPTNPLDDNPLINDVLLRQNVDTEDKMRAFVLSQPNPFPKHKGGNRLLCIAVLRNFSPSFIS